MLKGEIKDKDGNVKSKISGTYMGYIDFDDQRYWDVRDMVNYAVQGADLKTEALNSDCRNRIDSLALLAGDVEEA